MNETDGSAYTRSPLTFISGAGYIRIPDSPAELDPQRFRLGGECKVTITPSRRSRTASWWHRTRLHLKGAAQWAVWNLAGRP